mmetsp:Transcript_13228/g.22790  ORF Transcript_13228/g.22790 Transcript_13228/m.22790 type:complete len:107 (-) Transcript_13228:57-377(-)
MHCCELGVLLEGAHLVPAVGLKELSRFLSSLVRHGLGVLLEGGRLVPAGGFKGLSRCPPSLVTHGLRPHLPGEGVLGSTGWSSLQVLEHRLTDGTSQLLLLLLAAF